MIHPQLLVNDMDSDAVFDDLLEIEIDGRVYVDEEDSNLMRVMAEMDLETTMEIKLSVFRWKSIECGPANDAALDLRDCHHFSTLIRYLTLFRDDGHAVNASNLWEFNLVKIMESLDHIISVHELLSPEHRAEIQRHLSIHVACDEGSECNVLKMHANRRRERERERSNFDTNFVDEVERECILMNETLCSVHSLLMHRDYELRGDMRISRFQNEAKGQNEEEKDQTNELQSNTDALNAIDFGVSVLRWIPFAERPRFKSFRDEITRNQKGTITEEMFEQFLIECSVKIRNTTFTLKEMMALKLFTDFTKFQSYLRKAHWVSTSLSMKKSFYFWGSALFEAALYHSVPIPSANGKTPEVLYHGVNKMFAVDAEIPKYHGPFSSTTARSVAQHFTNEQGLFFKMRPSYINKLKSCLGTRLESISCFKNEREILLIDQFLPITAAKTFKNTDNALVDYLLNSVKSWSSEIRDRNRFLQQLGIRFVSRWLTLMEQHPLLCDRTAFEGRSVVIRLVIELKIFSQKWIPLLVDQQLADKTALISLVEKFKVKQLLPAYRVMTSKFKVIQSFHLNLCVKIEFIPNTKMDYIGGDNCVNDLCFEETEYIIDGVVAPFTVPFVNEAVRNIQCRNVDVFGDRNIWSQEFPGRDDREPTKDEIIDCIEKRKLKQLLPHYRVLTSKFRVIQSHLVNQLFEIEFIQNTKLDHIDEKEAIDDACFKVADYTVNGLPAPYTVSSFPEIIHRISCRHTALFGDEDVWVQDFPVPLKQDVLFAEIVQIVEDHGVHQLLPHYRVLTSKFRVTHSQGLHDFSAIEFIPNTKMNHLYGNHNEGIVNDSCFEETEYRINGAIIHYTESGVKGPVRRIQCKNINLFGDRDVLIQEFTIEETLLETVEELRPKLVALLKRRCYESYGKELQLLNEWGWSQVLRGMCWGDVEMEVAKTETRFLMTRLQPSQDANGAVNVEDMVNELILDYKKDNTLNITKNVLTQSMKYLRKYQQPLNKEHDDFFSDDEEYEDDEDDEDDEDYFE